MPARTVTRCIATPAPRAVRSGAYPPRRSDRRWSRSHEGEDMLQFRPLLMLVGVGFMGSVVIAERLPPAQSAPSAATNQRAAAVPASPYQVVATVQDLMDAMIAPASKAVFDAVSTEVTASGAVEKVPKNDDEWATV